MILFNDSGHQVEYHDHTGELLSPHSFKVPLDDQERKRFKKVLRDFPLELRQDIGETVENNLDVYSK